jgi:predicted small secreted protein
MAFNRRIKVVLTICSFLVAWCSNTCSASLGIGEDPTNAEVTTESSFSSDSASISGLIPGIFVCVLSCKSSLAFVRLPAPLKHPFMLSSVERASE